MTKIILTSAFILISISLLIFSQKESYKDELAYRISRSESFLMIVELSEKNYRQIKLLPDSTKHNFLGYKNFLSQVKGKSFLLNNKMKDSVMKISATVIKDLNIDVKTTSTIYTRFFSDFPEYVKLSAKDKSVVFKKAFYLTWKSGNTHI